MVLGDRVLSDPDVAVEHGDPFSPPFAQLQKFASREVRQGQFQFGIHFAGGPPGHCKSRRSTGGTE